MTTSNFAPVTSVENTSQIHHERVNGIGLSHGDNTNTVHPISRTASWKVVCHQSKSRVSDLVLVHRADIKPQDIAILVARLQCRDDVLKRILPRVRDELVRLAV